MNDATENNTDNPIEVFAGTAWEVALVESLLENAEITPYTLDFKFSLSRPGL